MRFEPSFVDDVKRRTSLAALIAKTDKIANAGGGRFKAPCRFCGSKKAALSISETKGVWHCFKCQAAGDAVTWVMQTTSATTFVEAVTDLAVRAGMMADAAGYKPAKPNPVVSQYDAEAEARKRGEAIAWAREVWGQTLPLMGSVAEHYLNRRGIFARYLPDGWPVTLRFHPSCAWTDVDEDTGKVIRRLTRPALVAAVQGVDRLIQGVHRTYLKHDGSAKAGLFNALEEPADKKMGGVCMGGAVRLGFAGAEINLAEGLETSLTVQMGTGETTWAALSLANMGAIDFPEHIERVVKWTDADESDRDMARESIRRGNERHAKAGLLVREVPAPEGQDWNDVHMAKVRQAERKSA